MADSIQPKNTQQEALRVAQQQRADRKKALIEQQKQDLHAMKQFYAQKNHEIDNESAAAINHISPSAKSSDDTNPADQAHANASNIANRVQAYNRQARTVGQNNQASEDSVKKVAPKKEDDFYKVQDRGSKMTNDGDKYVIEAYAPEGEQNDLRVSVQSNKAIISGQRKNSAEIEQGSKKITTNNFQTFREEFKFDKPVSHDGMTRERVGDFIRFSIPKLETIKDSTDKDV